MALFDFDYKNAPLASPVTFVGRMIGNIFAAFILIAVSLAIGIFVGTRLPQETSAPVQVEAGKLYAASSLNQALDTELASAPTGDVRIGITYRDSAGEICRTFVAPAGSGLVCRNSGRWQMKGLFGAPEGQGSDYRMAAGMDPNLAALVDSTIAGAAFDEAQEKAAKAKGWK